MTELLTIKAPADTKFTVEANADWFARFFAGSSDYEQAQLFAAMIRQMSAFPIQWDYVAIEIDKRPDAREIKDVLAMLGRYGHD